MQWQDFIASGLGRASMVIIVLALTVFFERSLRSFLRHHVHSHLKHVDKTHYAVFKHMLTAIIYLFGIGVAIYLIPPLKSLSISLFASAGVIAVIVGFAAQKAFANLIGGIFIALFKPFRVGDLIRFAERQGFVEDITLRHTVIRNFQNKRFVVPNAVMSEEIIENYNIEDQRVCKFVEIGIAYDADLDKAMKILADEVKGHKDYLDIRSEAEKKAREPPVKIKVVGFTDSAVTLRAWAWAKDPITAFFMSCDLNESIKRSFDRHGVEIPFPYRTVVYKRDIAGKRRKKKR